MGTTSDQHFSKGKEVEVSGNEEGFMGAFYLAKIIESPKSTPKKRKEPKKVLIEYKTLLTDDGSGPLTELVELSNIRPLPPEDDGKPFEEGEAVDARWMDGWWTGVVRKVENSKYRVYCDNPPDILEVERKDLRLHWKWVNGKWVRPEKQQSTGSIFSSGTAVEVKLDMEKSRDVWVPAIVVRENEGSFLVKHQASENIAEGKTAQYAHVDTLHIRPTQPRFVERDYKLLEKVEYAYSSGWRVGLITKVLSGRRYNVYFKHENEDKVLSHSEVRPQAEWENGKWTIQSKDVLIASDQPEQDGASNLELAGKVENSDSAKINISEKTPRLSNASKNPLGRSTSAIERSLLDPNSKRESFTFRNGNIVRLAPSKLTKRSSAEKASSTASNQSSKILNDVTCKEAVNGMPTPMTGGEGTKFSKLSLICDQSSAKTESPLLEKTTKTKRQKVGPLDDQTSSHLKKNVKAKGVPNKGKDGNTGSAEKSSKGEAKTNAAVAPLILGLQASTNAHKKNVNDTVQGNPVISPQEIGTGGNQKRKRGRPRKLSVANVVSSAAGREQKGVESVTDQMAVDHASEKVDLIVASQDALRQKTSEGSENSFKIRELTIARDSKNITDDDQPLSTWIEGIRPSSIEESRRPSGKNVNEVNEARGGQAGDVEESPVTDCEDGGLLRESQSLPFEKKSAFWKTLESMDVFNLLPQKPHFQPLSKMKEEFREGSAIGIMITFADLFEKISALQVNGPRNAITSILGSLDDLEKHGFEITLLQSRLNALLSIKDQLSNIKEEREGHQSKVVETNNEITKIQEEKAVVEKTLAELKQRISTLEQEMKDKVSKAATLKLHSHALNECLDDIKKEFEKVASAPW